MLAIFHRMDKFLALLCFMSFVLLFTQKFRADGSSDTIKDNVFVGIGAIVDAGSQVGKEQRLAMQMAGDDINTRNNQSLVFAHQKL